MRSLLYILTFISTSYLFSQENYLFMTRGSLSHAVNPAFAPTHKFEVNVFTPTFSFATNGISIDDFVTTIGDTNYISIGKLAGNLKGDDAQFDFGSKIGTFNFSMTINKMVVSIGHELNQQISSNIPYSLINLAAKGNAAFIGQDVSGTFTSSINVFQNIYAGLSLPITKKIRLGAKIHYLNGFLHLNTNDSKFTISTSDDYYRIKISSEYNFTAAGIFEYQGEEGTYKINDVLPENFFGFKKNKGIGFDLGANIEINEKSNLLLSITQLGKINWNTNSQRFTQNEVYEYKGIDIKDIIDDKVNDITVSDSIENFLKLKQSEADFSSAIPANLNAAYTYFGEKYHFGVATQIADFTKSNSYTVSLMGSKVFGKVLELGVAYHLKKNSYANAGIFGKLNLGPIALFGGIQSVLPPYEISKIDNLGFTAGASLRLVEIDDTQNP